MGVGGRADGRVEGRDERGPECVRTGPLVGRIGRWIVGMETSGR